MNQNIVVLNRVGTVAKRKASSPSWPSLAKRAFGNQGSGGDGADQPWERVLPARNVYAGDSPLASPAFISSPKTVRVVGAPMTLGQPLAGTDFGPELVREKGLVAGLAGLDWRVDDHGNLILPTTAQGNAGFDASLGKAKNCVAVGEGNKVIYEHCLKSANDSMFTLVVGGDHSIAVGTVAAALKARPDVGIVWVDAHADMNTPEISPSGNMHGMPLGLLMHLMDPTLIPGFEWLKDVPKLNPDQVSFIGLRDVDGGEARAIRSMGIQAFTMHHIDKYGIGAVVEKSLAHLDGRPIHMSYDIDAVDPVEAPSTGTVVRGGLTFREAHYVAEAVSDSGNLVSMDIVEVNPQLSPGDGADMTAEMGLQLTLSAMGTRIL